MLHELGSLASLVVLAPIFMFPPNRPVLVCVLSFCMANHSYMSFCRQWGYLAIKNSFEAYLVVFSLLKLYHTIGLGFGKVLGKAFRPKFLEKFDSTLFKFFSLKIFTLLYINQKPSPATPSSTQANISQTINMAHGLQQQHITSGI